MNRKPLRVLNMTRLFSKEMYIYSFFDVKLQKPARLSTFAYFFGVGIPFWLILIKLLHVPINVYTVAIGAAVPLGCAVTMSKPIWNGRNFISWFKVQIQHIGEHKLFADGWAIKPLKNYIIDFSIYLSRLNDFMQLKQLDKKGNDK